MIEITARARNNKDINSSIIKPYFSIENKPISIESLSEIYKFVMTWLLDGMHVDYTYKIKFNSYVGQIDNCTQEWTEIKSADECLSVMNTIVNDINKVLTDNQHKVSLERHKLTELIHSKSIK